MSSTDDQLRNERILFLNQLAENPDIDVFDLGDRLSVPKEKTMAYLRSFFKTVAEYTNQDDKLDQSGYLPIKSIMNEGVNVEFGGLTDKAISNLFYVYEKYRKLQPDLYIEADGIRATRTFKPRVIAHSQSSRIPGAPEEINQEIPSYRPESQPQPGGIPIPEKGENFNVDRLNKGFSYDFLANLKRIGLVRWALEGLPYPPAQSKIESYAQYFEINQDEIFMSPDALRTSLMKWFGDKTGDHAASIIYSYVKFLAQSEGFGVQKITGQLRDGYFAGDNPFNQTPTNGVNATFGAVPRNVSPFGQQQHSGPRFQDPFNTFYHANFVLPYGMSAYTDDARRLIHEYERKRKEKEEQKEKMDEIMDAARNKMSMAWAEMFEAKKGGSMQGGGNEMFGPQFMQSMIMMSMLSSVSSGKMVALPYTDESGKPSWKLEQSQQSDTVGGDSGVPTFRDSLELIKTMYDTIDKKREDATNFKLDWIKESMNKEQRDPIETFGKTIEALKGVIPGFALGGNGHGENAIELNRLALERDKFNYDRERTDVLIDHKFEAEQERQKQEHEDALQANKTRTVTIKAISNAVSNNLPMLLNLIIMFISMRNPNMAPMAAALGGGGGMMGRGGGGLGGITDIIGGLLKGISGGANKDEDEEEDEEPKKKHTGFDPFSSMFNKGNEAEEEEEDNEGDNLDVNKLLGGVTDLLKNMGVAQPSPPMQQAAGEVPMQQQHRHVHRHMHPRPRGIRPSFRDVEIGNPDASVVMPRINEEAANAYEDIEMTNMKRIKMNPSISDAPAQVEMQPFVQDDVIIPNPSQEEEVVEEEIEYEEGDTNEGEEEEGPEYPEYTPEHFKNKSPEELLELKRRGIESMNSTESYLGAIDEQLKKSKKA